MASEQKRRWWQRPVRVEVRYERQILDEHYREHSERCTTELRAEIGRHQPQISGTPGIGTYADRFYCSVCRTPWPCRFVRWALPLADGELAPIWDATNPTDGRLPNPVAAALGSREAGEQ